MKQLFITDMTVSALAQAGTKTGFKEKIEIIRHLEQMGVDVIALPAIDDVKGDTLLVRTMCAFAKSSTLSIDAGKDTDTAALAWSAVQGAANPRLCVSLPVSATQMEYVYHKKAPKMLEHIKTMVSFCAGLCPEVEFCAQDATRADFDFLCQAVDSAIACGATVVTLCDNAAVCMPADVSALIEKVLERVPAMKDVRLGISASDSVHMGLACALAAVGMGANEVRCATMADAYISATHLCALLKDRAEAIGVSTRLAMTQVYREIRQIEWILSADRTKSSLFAENPAEDTPENEPALTKQDTPELIAATVRRMGYDLSEEDQDKVYSAFLETAARKAALSAKELDAIVASVALQVPPTYTLVSFVINSGNVIGATAQVTLEKDGVALSGFSMGDGPIDAAFRAIEQIVGIHYELDDFRITSVTEGHEAMGSALVRLRSAERLYAGQGTSTDIIDAGIRAYVGALNKIAYEEAQS